MDITQTITGSTSFDVDTSFNLGTVWASGSFNGGTLKLQLAAGDGLGYVDVPDSTMVSSTMYNMLGGFGACRVVFTSGSLPCNVNVRMKQIF